MIKYLFSDVDDTITTKGVLELEALKALYLLKNNNIKTILISGGSSGQALTYISQWPIDAIITESGALAYYKENNEIKKWVNPLLDLSKYENQIDKKLTKEILNSVEGSKLAFDSFTRLYDIAIDHSQNKPYLEKEKIKDIVNIANKYNANYLISSIHINIYFGSYDKEKSLLEFLPFYLNKDFKEINSESAYIGDSLNDECLFKIFKNTYGVKNIENYLDKLKFKPKIIAKKEGGKGFLDIINTII